MFNNDITPNRLAKFFPVEPPEPPRQSTADKLLCGAWSAKISLLRFEDDDGETETSCEVEIKSTIEGEPAALLADLLAQFRTPRGEAGAA